MTTAPQSEAATIPVRPGEEPWTSEELAEVRQTLEEEATGVRSDIATAESQVAARLDNGLSDAGDDEADVGVKTFERDHEWAMASNARNLLEQTEKGLARIDAGSYGVCESCREALGRARLVGLVHAARRTPIAGEGQPEGQSAGQAGDQPVAATGRPRGTKLPVVIG